MKIKKKYIIISVLVVLVIIAIPMYNFRFTLPFEEVYVAKNVYPEKLQEYRKSFIRDKDAIYWQTLKAEKYRAMADSLYEKTGIDEIDQLDLDKENYTYFVVFGHKLKKITYSYSDRLVDLDDVLPNQFTGHIYVDKEADQNVYVYKTKKMNINNDFYDIERTVTLE